MSIGIITIIFWILLFSNKSTSINAFTNFSYLWFYSCHGSYLTDMIYQKPVMIYNYPKEAKPFYARQNDDGTVAAFDLVVPKVWSEVYVLIDWHCFVCCSCVLKFLENFLQLGTIISGSQNEERLNMISSRYCLFTLS